MKKKTQDVEYCVQYATYVLCKKDIYIHRLGYLWNISTKIQWLPLGRKKLKWKTRDISKGKELSLNVILHADLISFYNVHIGI